MNGKPTHLDLFSGIGGFSIAFERAGFETIGFSEIDPWSSAVLRRHWPNVKNYGDVRNIKEWKYPPPQMSSLQEIHAKRTQKQDKVWTQQARLSAMNSSVLLQSLALALFCEKTQATPDQMRLGLGGECGPNWSALDMLCCPSDFDPVALGLNTSEKDCSCSVNYPTPCARDWKGQSSKSWRERPGAKQWSTLPDKIKGKPHPEFTEQLMGFPVGHTELSSAEIRSIQKLQRSSRKPSTKN